MPTYEDYIPAPTPLPRGQWRNDLAALRADLTDGAKLSCAMGAELVRMSWRRRPRWFL